MFHSLRKTAIAILAVSTFLVGCGETAAPLSDPYSDVAVQGAEVSHNDSGLVPEIVDFRRSAYDLATRAAEWQLAQIGNLSYIPESHRAKSENPKFWIQASFFIGLTRWIDESGNKDLLAYVENMALEQNYETITERRYHADDHAIGQTYLWLAEKTGNQKAYIPTKNHFDWILTNKPDVGLEMLESSQSVSGKYHREGNCQLRWCWADALFMAPRAWLKLSNFTGNQEYFEYADSEFWATADYLFSNEHGLFFRDSRYFDLRSDNGAPVFWGRGNGWVFASIPLIIDDLPKDHPSRARYIDLYKKNAAALLKLQTATGYWPASLMDPDKVKTPEVSGTGFITYGLAWGVNNGILTDDHSREVVEKGWAALVDAVEPNGRVNWVQHVGKSPDPVKQTDSQLYGVGAPTP